MPYILTRRVLDCKVSLSLSEDEFGAAKRSKEHLIRALGLEERLDMVIKSYVEFEHELLQTSLNNALRLPQSWSEFREIVQQIDRRLANLLSTCRLYLDHLRHAVSSSDTGDDDLVDRLTAEQYRNRRGYRVMEALRNRVQHRGLPTHSVTLGGGWIDTPEGKRRSESTTLFPNVGILRGDAKFKRSVLKELGNRDGKAPLKPLVREYVTGVMKVHVCIREHFADATNAAQQCLDTLIERFQLEAEPETIGLAAVEIDDAGVHVDPVEIFSDIAERLRVLERKNRGIGDLSLIIVSS